MKTVLRFIVTTTGLLLILMAIGLILLSTQAGYAAEMAIERGLGFVYNTDVAVNGVVFSPRDRAVTLQGLTIFNPAPFKEGPAIQLGEVTVRVDPATLLSSAAEIEEITLHDARFYLRYEAGHGTNLGQLDSNARRTRTAVEDKPGVPVAERQITIKKFHSEEATLDVSAGFLPSSLQLTVAPFTLDDLSNTKPLSTADVCSLFIRSVFREALTLRGLAQPLIDKLNDELQRIREGDRETPADTV